MGGVGCSSVGRVFTQLEQSPGFCPHCCINLGLLEHTCSANTLMVEVEEVQSHIQVHFEFRNNLFYVRSHPPQKIK